MKLIDAINEVDNLKPNMYGLTDKIKWLSRLDQRIFEQIILTHELSEEERAPFLEDSLGPLIDGDLVFVGYDENDQDKELIVHEPYDEIYTHWLSAQIDWNNREFIGFNSSNAMFEATYGAFRNAFNQTHMPKSARKRYF